MKKLIVIILLLTTVIILADAKAHLSVKLLNSFELPTPDSLNSGYHYGVTDSVIILAERIYPGPFKLACYDFEGNRVNNIVMPVDSIAYSTFGINYLPESKLLTYADGDFNLHYVNFDGQEQSKRKHTGDIVSLYMKVLEYGGEQYLLSWNPYEAWDRDNGIVTWSTTIYRTEGDSLWPVRKRVYEKDYQATMYGESSQPGVMTYGILLDSDLDHNMVLADETDKCYKVTFSTPDSVYAFEIKRNKKELMYSLYAGEDFLYLITYKPEGKTGPATGVYDLQGRKVCSESALHKKKGDGYFVDIVNDKLVIHDSKRNILKIYEIKLTD